MTRLLIALLAGLLVQVGGAAQTAGDATRAGRQVLAPTGVLRAAFLGNNPVQGRVDRATGKVTGLVADVTTQLAAALDVPPRLIPAPDAAAVIDAVNRGAADIGYLAYDVEREAQIDYAGALAVMRNSYVVAANSPVRSSADVDTPGAVVGAVRLQTQQLFLSANLRNAKVRIYDQQFDSDIIEKLLTNGLTAFAMNRQRALDVAKLRPGVRALPDSFLDVPQAFVVRKGDTARRDALLKVAADLRASGFVAASLRKAGLQESAAAATGEPR